ncbi:ribbon-helix-helix domain-containing protein [Deinococcus planocerae]|uniref:ribbon-helix-helix domain-containing protein n=1 Tax=Deinococcus planocerae TaxID=1737569 RepID=UPI000C7F40F1|nr:ribbon-helix-helix domain-containing protein [Deinococcus planocerae]
MTVGKISVSLEEPLLDFLSHYQETHRVRSKSEVIAQALTLLRERELETQYAEALAEWRANGEGDLWESVIADGLSEGSDAAR